MLITEIAQELFAPYVGGDDRCGTSLVSCWFCDCVWGACHRNVATPAGIAAAAAAAALPWCACSAGTHFPLHPGLQ